MKLNKKLGQHLLNNPSFYNNVLKYIVLKQTDKVFEIGPGIGYFTKEILKYVSDITVFELDKKFCYILKNHFKEKIKVVNEDVLKIDLTNYLLPENNNFVLGNLPYYITTPIIKHLIRHKNLISKCGLMVQKEFAQKLIALPKEKNWTSMSIVFQLNFDVEKVFYIDKKAFNPPPKVDSAFIIIKPIFNNYFKTDEEYLKFSFFVRELFNQKRKKISNVIKNIIKDKNIIVEASSKFDFNKRAEEFTIQELVEIFKNLKI